MTMDIQNNYQNYKENSPEAKVTNLTIESARTSPVIKSEMESTALNKSAKRSFDVAFLMMPDEKLRQKPPEKHLRVSKQIFNNEEWGTPQSKRSVDIYKATEYIEHNDDANDLEKYNFDDRLGINNNVSPGLGSDVNIDVGTDEYPGKYCSDSETSERSRSRPNSNESAARTPKFLPESPYKNKIFDDPTLISIQTRARYDHPGRYSSTRPPDASPKSAFTKVSNYVLRSPNPSVSPDNLLYQNSISPPLSAASSPSDYNKAPAFNNLLPPAHLLNGNSFFKGQNVPPGYDAGAPHPAPRTNAGFKPMDYNDKPTDPKNHNKLNFLSFRPEIPTYLQAGSAYPFAVQNFQSPNSDFMKFPMPAREQVNPLMTNPAAAFLSTLLPPTLAAFSLPSQNVCAKCSLSFRMTSDLVYHMRTHHKSEAVADAGRRRREDKLKCPVCNESFRERHHLTRHMTAHQDKEGDMDDSPHSSHHKKSKYYNSSVIHK